MYNAGHKKLWRLSTTNSWNILVLCAVLTTRGQKSISINVLGFRCPVFVFGQGWCLHIYVNVFGSWHTSDDTPIKEKKRKKKHYVLISTLCRIAGKKDYALSPVNRLEFKRNSLKNIPFPSSANAFLKGFGRKKKGAVRRQWKSLQWNSFGFRNTG